MMVNAKKFFILAALLLLQLSFSMAYNCPDTCVGPSCRCATHEIPGGLSPEETPQFIVFTNDDAVTVMTQPAILNITERHVNRNGCRMPATWFISQQYTDPALVQQVYAKGHEIATHTMTHVQNPSVDEIVGCKLWLHNTAKIPMEDIKGYRSPFLAFSPAQRKVLFENGFGYDSSITETYPSETSPDSGNLLWPYSMDYGIGQNCAISTGTCDANEKYPGMWEFPMWNVQDATGMSVAYMDPVGDLYTLYKTMFDQRYNGNRAPLGIFFHAARLIGWPEGMDELNRFIEYAMTKENVWLVTASQAMDWVKNPVPASEYSVECSVQNEMLGQNGGQLCVMPSSGCQYGLWNSAACVCECQNEKINAAGYCKDAEGSCSLQKDYDFTATTYVCNSPPQPPTTAPSTTPTPTAPTTPTTPTTTTPTVPPTAAVVVSSKEEGCNGHPILSYTGMSMSGTGDPSALYAAATKVIDSKCDTCSEAMPAGSHSFFTVSLSASQDITSVKVFSPSNMYVDLFIGDSLTNNGMENAQCASSAHIVPNVDNTIPCVGKGKVVTIRAPGPMTLCDVYPVSAVTEVVAPVSGSTTAAGTVKAVIDVMGASAVDFQAKYSIPICTALGAAIGDTNATCTIFSATLVTDDNRRRRSLLQSNPAGQQGLMRVTMQVVTTKPEEALALLSDGNALAPVLSPIGVTVVPESVQAVWVDQPATAPSNAADESSSSGGSSSSSSGSSSNMGAIIGGVVGGLVCCAVVVMGVLYVKKRRSSNATDADTGLIGSARRGYSGVTASVSVSKNSRNSSSKGMMEPTWESPLRDSMARGV